MFQKVEREPLVNTPTAPMQRFPQWAPVWSHQYNQACQQWLPGKVTSSRGRRLVMVDTVEGMQCGHVDQMPLRHQTTVLKQELCATRTTEQQPSPRDPTTQDQLLAGENIEPTDSSLGTSRSPSETN
ncbi:hypothetical protein MTO96_044517 [Rhipicephalus appendiculatus]